MFKSLFVSGREINYPRNQLFVSALQDFSDMKIVGREKADISRGGILYILRQSMMGLFSVLLKRNLKHLDFIFVGFFGHLLVLSIATFLKIPIIFDVFVSAYDTFVHDRQIIRTDSLFAKLMYLLDKKSCEIADLVFIDTQAHAKFFHCNFHIPNEKMNVVYVGCDEDIFYPREIPIDETKVLYYCSFLPLHGVDVVVRAAQIVEKSYPLKFRIIGNGVEEKKVRGLAMDLGLRNIEFVDQIPQEKLPDEIASSLLCLGGHFGFSEKAKHVIPGKIFQIIAMGKPVIVGENKANRELLTHNEDAWFCEMSNPEALAKSIITLYEDMKLREKLGAGAYHTFKEKASKTVLKMQIRNAIEDYFFEK